MQLKDVILQMTQEREQLASFLSHYNAHLAQLKELDKDEIKGGAAVSFTNSGFATNTGGKLLAGGKLSISALKAMPSPTIEDYLRVTFVTKNFQGMYLQDILAKALQKSFTEKEVYALEQHLFPQYEREDSKALNFVYYEVLRYGASSLSFKDSLRIPLIWQMSGKFQRGDPKRIDDFALLKNIISRIDSIYPDDKGFLKQYWIKQERFLKSHLSNVEC